MTSTPHTAISTDPIPTTLAVTHVLRRDHDHSLISAHCCQNCGALALSRVSMAAIMGDNPPGPLELARVHLHPTVGPLELAFTMSTTADNGHRLLMLSAAPGSPSADALDLLRRSAVDPRSSTSSPLGPGASPGPHR